MPITFQNPYFLAIIPLSLIFLFLISYKNFGKLHFFKKLLLIFEFSLFVLLSIYLAQPYAEFESKALENQRIIVFEDNSDSMQVFDKPEFNRKKFEFVNIGKNASSNLFSNIISNLRENSTAILITDGFKTSGPDISDLLAVSENLNAELYYLNLTPSTKELSVTIEGPEKVLSGVDNNFSVKVGGIFNGSETADMEVKLDGEILYRGKAKDFTFTRKFDSGEHVIIAEIKAQDIFEINNRYYKVVEVIENPKILYISEKRDPIEFLINKIYNADYLKSAKNLGNDLEQYYAIIMNDLNTLPENLTKLQNFLSQGNGLVVIGGENSFKENYKGEFEEILPVKISGLEEEEAPKIVLVIDISASTGLSFKTDSGNIIVDVEKALALSTIESLSDKAIVGALAFNTKAYKISEPKPLLENRENLKEKIASLKHFGGTEIAKALLGAKELIGKNSGSIILISDGRSNIAGDKENALILSKKLKKERISVHAISVGEKSDEGFLKKLASNGGGFFLKPDEYQRIKIILKGEKEKSQEGRSALVILDKEHFITKGIELESKVGSYNPVKAKSLARKLVVTSNNRPGLTVWRFGAGRVASINVFDGKSLGNILERDSELIVRTINWAIGNPKRKMGNYTEVQSSTLDKEVKVYVKNKDFENGSFSEIEENLFFFKFKPKEIGIGEIFGKKYAVNYPKEYRNFGVNEKFLKLLENANAKIISAEGLNNIRKFIKGKEKNVKVRKNIGDIFLISSILIFFAAIATRRVIENLLENDTKTR